MARLTMHETGADYLAVLMADEPGRFKGADENEIMFEIDLMETSIDNADAVRDEMIRRGF